VEKRRPVGGCAKKDPDDSSSGDHVSSFPFTNWISLGAVTPSCHPERGDDKTVVVASAPGVSENGEISKSKLPRGTSKSSQKYITSNTRVGGKGSSPSGGEDGKVTKSGYNAEHSTGQRTSIKKLKENH